MLEQESYNLARKWRVQSFDAIIGQPLVVRMLKNSLYAQHYFPVYLFFGQHGCGKTSTARIFAMAANCAKLSEFQKNPKTTVIPCKKCASCCAMLAGNHPDFIEIDAASYTGVDNVRHIIEASSFLPILGHKKIYLIDEAHMLSKAAFNALLKILEEPPKSVFFMLATTDSEKIIDTVKSRCFQLFFNPVTTNDLRDYLIHLCIQESIACTNEGIDVIAQQAKGSVRDALNMIEGMRFAYEKIDAPVVYKVLGQVADATLFQLLTICWFGQHIQELGVFMHTENMIHATPAYVWQRLQELLRHLLWLKYGVPVSYTGDMDALQTLVHKVSLAQVHTTIEEFYRQEPIFIKTLSQQLFLELVLSRIMHNRLHNFNNNMHDDNNNNSNNTELPLIKTDSNSNPSIVASVHQNNMQKYSGMDSWHLFMTRMQELGESLLLSIFQQAVVSISCKEVMEVTLAFAKNKTFFDELISNKAFVWQKIFTEIFGATAICKIEYSLDDSIINTVNSSMANKEQTSSHVPAIAPVYKKKTTAEQNVSPKNILDISDVQKWPKTNKILQQFPGTVRLDS